MSPKHGRVNFVIEPFDPEKHDRTAFSCGIQLVDNYFQKIANKLANADNVRLYVMSDPDSGNAVVGFYAINAHAVHYGDLPKKFARTRPSHGNIPAAYISMIGRDRKYGYFAQLVESKLFFHSRFAVPGRLAIVLDRSMIDFRRHFEIRFALVESAAIGDLRAHCHVI